MDITCAGSNTEPEGRPPAMPWTAAHGAHLILLESC